MNKRQDLLKSDPVSELYALIRIEPTLALRLLNLLSTQCALAQVADRRRKIASTPASPLSLSQFAVDQLEDRQTVALQPQHAYRCFACQKIVKKSQ